MSKYILIPLLLLFLLLKIPMIANAAPSISPIGDLQPGKINPVTISGLDANKRYHWKESKLTGVTLGKSYTVALSKCIDSNDAGEIQQDIGPYMIPGIYLLVISLTTSAPDECKPLGVSLKSQEFSVGGKTGQSCCTVLFPVYDRGRDYCKKDLFDSPLTPNPKIPTECKKTDTYCEPDSLQCFTTKSFVVNSKICLDPTDPKFNPKFDKNKYAICASAGGKPCDNSDPSNPGIATAIGCIHTNPAEFTKDLLKFVIGIGGGLAFLMMLLGAFQMLTSAGNPETLQAGRERLTSAIIGLLVIIFSVLLLQIIGVDILGLPGFGR